MRAGVWLTSSLLLMRQWGDVANQRMSLLLSGCVQKATPYYTSK
jgi:hypothetical protein